MGNNAFIETQRPVGYNPEWFTFRNHKRIGFEVATDILGEGQRFDKPVLTNSWNPDAYDAMLVSNPAVTINADGSTIMIYKQVTKNGTFKGGSVKFGVAFAQRPTGDFEKRPEPIFEESSDNGQSWMVAEDPFLWQQNGKYYAIIRDVQGLFSGNKGGLALMMSNDAIEWKPTPTPQVMGLEVVFTDGSKTPHCIERPWLLFENGRPKYLFGAIGLAPQRTNSGNIAIQLQ